MKASMVYWKLNDLNTLANEGIDNSDIDDVGRIVNGSGTALPNGWEARRSYASQAFTILNNN